MTTDLKPTIMLLRSLNDVVYNLYMAVYAEEPNASLSSSVDLISNDESPLVQCTDEPHP
jgi:hypothetical protein